MERPGILLIEDDYDDSNMMVRILRKYRIANHVEAYRDGNEALRALRNGTGNVELALLGMSRPEAARETVERLRGLPGKPDQTGAEIVPVILCCRTPEEERQAKQWGLPRVAVMSKPVGFFKLLECIQKLEMHWQVFGSKPQ